LGKLIGYCSYKNTKIEFEKMEGWEKEGANMEFMVFSDAK